MIFEYGADNGRALHCCAAIGECSLVVASDERPYGLACGKYILYLLYVVNTLMPCGRWYTFPLAFLLALAKLKYIHMGHVDATQIDTMKTQI